MTRVFARGSAHIIARSLLMVVLGLVMGLASTSPTPSVAPAAVLREVKTASFEGQPLEVMLPKLHPSWRDYLEAFAAAVPGQLPELAHPFWMAFDPVLPMPKKGPVLVKWMDGYADIVLGLANPGSNTNQDNLLCLRNNLQVGCTPEVDVWKVKLPPKTLALVPIRIQANLEDHLVFLFLASRDPERAEPASGMAWVYVEQQPSRLPSEWVDAPQHTPVFGGCDFVLFIKDPSDTDTMNANLHSGVRRGTILYLLIQLCNPTGQEYVQLVPIVNRTTVVDLPGDFWHMPVRLTGAASIIPVDTSRFDQTHEFQIAVVPLSKEAVSALRRYNFTQAVAFSD